jgi:cell division transport system ATP-binding protein
VGPTGSGKTTLFRLLIRDLLPTTGSIVVSNFDLVKLPGKKIPHYRKKIGVVFQNLKLLFDRTILENVMLPLELSGVKGKDAKKRAQELLDQVGILQHTEKFPIQLSGGELQRAAIARALALSPDVLLADEPTGNLDPKTGKEIVKLLAQINEKGTTIIMATHNSDIVNSLKKRVIGLEKGHLVRDQKEGKYEIS